MATRQHKNPNQKQRRTRKADNHNIKPSSSIRVTRSALKDQKQAIPRTNLNNDPDWTRLYQKHSSGEVFRKTGTSRNEVFPETSNGGVDSFSWIDGNEMVFHGWPPEYSVDLLNGDEEMCLGIKVT